MAGAAPGQGAAADPGALTVSSKPKDNAMARSEPAFDSRPDLPIALVVGAGGMGMAVAQRLGQDHRVVLANLSRDDLEQGRSRLHELGVVSTGVELDVTSEASVAALAARLGELGPVQALAHVVGLSPSMAGGAAILSVNLTGAALVERAVGPLMARGGAAVFISSMAAHFTNPPGGVLKELDAPLDADLHGRLTGALGHAPSPQEAYPLSKLGMNRMVRARAFDWGRRGARIVSISPGLIDTPMGAMESDGSAGRTAMRAHLPIERDGTMADIADAVAFLISPRASYISGTDLLVDGGMVGALRASGAFA